MTKLNDAGAIYIGANAAQKVYVGSTLVWELPTGLPVTNNLIIRIDEGSAVTMSGSQVATIENRADATSAVAVGDGGPTLGVQNGLRSLVWPDTINNVGLDLQAKYNCRNVYMVLQYKDGLDSTADQFNSVLTPGYDTNRNRVILQFDSNFIRAEGGRSPGINTIDVNGVYQFNALLPRPLAVVKFGPDSDNFDVQGIGCNLQELAFDRSWQGAICEVLGYSAALSAEEETTLYTYLSDKWGFTL